MSSQEFASSIENGNVQRVAEMLVANRSLANPDNWTPPPLHCAVLWNQPRVAEVLLDHGADIEGLDPDRQTTPLRYAILYAKPEMISLLVARGANTGVIVDGGTTAMELATSAAEGHYSRYDDLPKPSHYAEVVALLRQLGVR